MEIRNNQNRIAFTSIPLHNVKLRRFQEGVPCGFVDAVVSRLEPEKDKDIVLNMFRAWQDKSAIVKGFKNRFLENNSMLEDEFFIISEKNSKEKPLGAFCAHPEQDLKTGNKSYHLSYIFSSPEYKSEGNFYRKIKGIGEVLMTKVFQRAKEINSASMDLFSANTPFYEHIFTKAGIYDYYPQDIYFEADANIRVLNKDFDKYIDYCERKYNFKY